MINSDTIEALMMVSEHLFLQGRYTIYLSRMHISTKIMLEEASVKFPLWTPGLPLKEIRGKEETEAMYEGSEKGKAFLLGGLILSCITFADLGVVSKSFDDRVPFNRTEGSL